MGTTIWILSKNKLKEGDDYDHSALFYAVERLDIICENLGLVKISSFLDWTDFNANMSEEEEFPDDDALHDQASWFNPSQALPMLKALREHLEINESDCKSLFDPDQYYRSDDLLEELDDCISKIEKIAAEGDLFHFCVVM